MSDNDSNTICEKDTNSVTNSVNTGDAFINFFTNKNLQFDLAHFDLEHLENSNSNNEIAVKNKY